MDSDLVLLPESSIAESGNTTSFPRNKVFDEKVQRLVLSSFSLKRGKLLLERLNLSRDRIDLCTFQEGHGLGRLMQLN